MAVGGRSFEGTGLTFRSERPVVVMITWDRRGISILSTADVSVRLRTGVFVPGLSADKARKRVWGRIGGAPKSQGPWLLLPLLEGEEVRIGGHRGGGGG
ncbi:MAG TPA: hypothetical protein EYP65_00955 [Armatimonadetes bacterium]|nr:hypothetical protein [Armatimonadota bacterium]